MGRRTQVNNIRIYELVLGAVTCHAPDGRRLEEFYGRDAFERAQEWALSTHDFLTKRGRARANSLSAPTTWPCPLAEHEAEFEAAQTG